jgi:hypothetical protein
MRKSSGRLRSGRIGLSALARYAEYLADGIVYIKRRDAKRKQSQYDEDGIRQGGLIAFVSVPVPAHRLHQSPDLFLSR